MKITSFFPLKTKVVYYNLFSVSINVTLYFSPMNKCLQNFSLVSQPNLH